MQDLDDRAWILSAPHAASARIDVSLTASPSFYFGPDDGGLAELKTQRELIDVALPLPDAHGLYAELGRRLDVARALEHVDAVIAYYRSLFSIARRHGKRLQPSSPELWMQPRVLVEDALVTSFPWIDTYAATTEVLTKLCADVEGELLSDLDQGYEYVVLREGSIIRVGQRDWETDDPGRAFALDRDLVVAEGRAARERLDRLLTLLTDALDEDPWEFRQARP